MTWIFVALLAVFSADAGVATFTNATESVSPDQSLDAGNYPPGPKP
jgi:hypothetical protein